MDVSRVPHAYPNALPACTLRKAVLARWLCAHIGAREQGAVGRWRGMGAVTRDEGGLRVVSNLEEGVVSCRRIRRHRQRHCDCQSEEMVAASVHAARVACIKGRDTPIRYRRPEAAKVGGLHVVPAWPTLPAAAAAASLVSASVVFSNVVNHALMRRSRGTLSTTWSECDWKWRRRTRVTSGLSTTCSLADRQSA